MQKSIFTLTLCLIASYSMMAQNHATCDGARYVSAAFTTIDSTEGVWFGNNTTFNGANQDLYMNIYEPNGDLAVMRPAIVLAFGGSFIGGEREDMDGLCRYYASRGYVAVSIDYRLYDGPLFPLPDSAAMTDVVIKAVGDMKAAIRHLRQDAATSNLYKIDSNLIFVGGISAGGIVAAHVAYVDSTDNLGANEMTAINNNGGYEGNSSNNAHLYSSETQGVVNFSGALRYAHYIDANDPPLFSAHDDMDGTVPYNGGMASVFGFPIIYVEGSGMMHPATTAAGVPNFLITIPNSNGHVSYFQGNAAQWQDTVQNTSTEFLHDNVICPLFSNVHTALQQDVSANFFPNPSDVNMMVEFETLPSTYSLQVFDNMGRQVYNETGINETRYTLEKQNFAAGVYVVNIQFEDSQYAPVRSKVIFR